MFRITAILRGRQMLEVERKFAPTLASIDLLTRNAGHPSFKKLESMQNTAFQDVYYDRDDVLNSKGIYVRRRTYLDASKSATDHWEAKVRVGGDFTNSAFQETTGIVAVSKLIKQHIEPTKLANGAIDIHEMLEVWARFVTKRRQWKVNEHFLVVLDEADFGHVVGEVELSQDSVEHVHENAEQHIARLDEQIEDFMLHHAWAFPPGKVQGKLSAYFKFREQRCLS